MSTLYGDMSSQSSTQANPANSTTSFNLMSYMYLLKSLGGIHKPCGHGRGEGVCQMSILLHKPYRIKWSTKEEAKKVRISVHIVYE